MLSEVDKLKKARAAKLHQFKRKNTVLLKMLDGETGGGDLKGPIKDFEDAYVELEAAHDVYCAELEDEASEVESGFLDGSITLYTETRSKINKAEAKLNLESKLVVFRSNMESFSKSAAYIVQLSEAKVASAADLRVELSMLDSKYKEMVKEKNEVLSIDSKADMSTVVEEFQSLVISSSEKCKTAAYSYMKESNCSSPSVVSTVADVTGGGRDRSGSGTNFSTTKRETVMLPKFSGDEKTAFLKYPIWKEQWDGHIVEYESKYRATMLLNHLDDKAMEQIVGYENDYDGAIDKLHKYYSDSNKVIRACLDEIRGHSQVQQFDYKGLVAYKKCLTNNHARLKACKLEHELSNTAALSVLIRKLPIQEVVKWKEYLATKDEADQTKPFPIFMEWLKIAGASWELLAASGTGIKSKSGSTSVHHTFFGDEVETDKSSSKKGCFKCGQEGHLKRDCTVKGPRQSGGSTGGGKPSNKGEKKDRAAPKHKKHHCAFHKDAKDKFCYTWSCPALKYVSFAERIKLLKANGDCELCCGDCPKGSCQAKSQRICGGNKDGRGCGANHVGHELYCQNAKLCFKVQVENVLETTEDEEDGVMLQVMKIPSLRGDSDYETALWDSACSGVFVRNDHARRQGFPCRQKRLRVVTLGGDVKEIEGQIFQCEIRDQFGDIHQFQAHGLDQITGALETSLSKELMRVLFPTVIGSHKLCGASQVDYLIGLGKASWQPERTIQASKGGDFWIWQNKFGTCVGGSHPLVGNSITRSDNLYTVLKVVEIDPVVESSLRIPTCSAFLAKSKPMDASSFFQSEQLGTIIEPKCGSCRCGACPVPGSRYSFREEAELKLIQENLRYDEENGCWVASYPFLYPRENLKGNKAIAVKSLQSTEKTLLKNSDWAKVYDEQITDMVNRGVARIVSREELESFNGHINYLPHLAALNPKSTSTPVRICFDASRPQGGGPSLNQVLAKGPDRFLNNLAGVILGFRNGKVAAKGDVSKMYNCIKLEDSDAYLQCFLWRNLDTLKEPLTYQVTANNIGVKPAGAIATLALHQSAEKFREEYPVTADQIKNKSYVDDLGITATNMEELRKRTGEADKILLHANMKVKHWVYSSSNQEVLSVGESSEVSVLGDLEMERMLGVLWDAGLDVFKFTVRVNLSPLKKKSRQEPDLSKQELIENPSRTITRRQYYSQIQSLFDPLGFLAPVMLQAKILLRKSWEGECEKLHWDDSLPQPLVTEMLSFFVELFDLEAIEFERSLWPKNEDVTGQPELIIFSDGSKLAFGAVAYIRWKLTEGSWYAKLVMAKSKIAPKNLLTIPRLELNGAVLSKRLGEFLTNYLDLSFGNVFHLVDSSTVLGYVHKPDSKLKPFEGVRVSEIQTAGQFVDGRLHNWAWIESENNPADWATKPRTVKELKSDGFWQTGPSFLRKDYVNWPIRLDFKKERLEGELQAKGVHIVMVVSGDMVESMSTLLEKVSSSRKLFRVTGLLYKWVKSGKSSVRDSNWLANQSKSFWIKFVQREINAELEASISTESGEKVHGKFRRLSPFLDNEGIWRVGSRLREFVPFTADHKAPSLLPVGNRLSTLLMEEAHQKKHSGVNETVAVFRLSGYWVPQAAKLARAVKARCVICRFLDKVPLNQVMGGPPKDLMVKPSAWSHMELDLFGPITCRSDVNKRSTMKVWGAVMVDKNSSAVHIDVVLNYSAQEVVKMLRRFGSLRGWPSSISSDPGSQLESSSGSLEHWWSKLNDQLSDFAVKSKFEWCVSPANSPWRQGRCESRIRVIKRLLKVSVGPVKLSPLELQTALFEVANLCNDRPIGVNKTPNSDGSYDVLTPNCLLLGRAVNSVPDDAKLVDEMKHAERYRLVQQVTSDFWKRWSSEVTPEAVIRQKWHESGRNLAPGDLVLVHESSPVKGRYTLAVVETVKISADGRVRSCKVGYRIPNPKDSPAEYSGGKWIQMTRSVQRLSLLLPIEEQASNLTVENNTVKDLPADTEGQSSS